MPVIMLLAGPRRQTIEEKQRALEELADLRDSDEIPSRMRRSGKSGLRGSVRRWSRLTKR